MIKFDRKYNRMFLNDVREAVEFYGMIKNGDRVAVGLSGGKDSIALLFMLKLLKEYSYLKFDLCGINIDLGFNNDMKPLIDFCSQNDIEVIIEKTDIGDVVFKDRKEKNPCSLCSKLRKGALYRVANREGYNTVALGHTSDDAIETFFMNMLCVGKLGIFSPCAYYEEKGLRIMRPMIYINEETVKKVVSMENLPVIESGCPVNGKTVRQEMKNLASELRTKYPDLNKKMTTAFENIDNRKMWKQRG